MKKRIEVAVIGAGMWGTALAGVLARKGYAVRAWEFNQATAAYLNKHRTHPALPDYKLPAGVKVYTDLAQAVQNPDIILMAVASTHVRGLARQIKALLKGRKELPYIIAVAKGIEAEKFKTICQIIEEEIHRPAAGP